MKHVFWILFSVTVLLSATRCGQMKDKQENRWKPYTQRMEEEACERRKQAGLQGRTAVTAVDSLGKMQTVAIDSFDADGHLIFNRTLDQTGKAIKELRHDYENGRLVHTSQLDARGVIHIYYRFDEAGNKSFEYVLASDTDTMLTRRYRYDDKGDETEAEFWRVENNMRARKRTEYDEQHRPVKVMEYEGDRLNWQELYAYTGDSKLTAERFDGFGALQKKFEMTFDSLGHCTRMEQYNGNGTSKVRVDYFYDNKGLLAKEETYGGKDLTEATAYSYDEKDMVTSRRLFAYGITTEIKYINRYRKPVK